MAFDWSSYPITARSTTLSPAVVNDIRNKTLDLINFMDSHDWGMCTAFDYNTDLNSIPPTVSSGTKIQSSWLSSMQTVIDLLDNQKYVAAYKYDYCSTDKSSCCGGRESGVNNSVDTNYYNSRYYETCSSNKTVYCTSLKSGFD